MERGTQTALALAESMKPDRKGKMYKEISDELKAEALTAEITKQQELLREVIQRGRVHLDNIEEVQIATINYMEACKISGSFPTGTGLASSFGLSRQAVNQWIRAHPDTETARFIELVRTTFANILMQQGLKRNCDNVLSIFLLKNSSQGFSDKLEIEPVPHDEEEKPTPADIMKKYEFLPDE